jgi:hypothetical protein
MNQLTPVYLSYFFKLNFNIIFPSMYCSSESFLILEYTAKTARAIIIYTIRATRTVHPIPLHSIILTSGELFKR